MTTVASDTAGLADECPPAIDAHDDRVSDVMTDLALTVDVQETLWDAWQLMFVSDMSHVIVLDDQVAVGVLGDRTLLTRFPLTPESLRGVAVGACGRWHHPTLRAADPASIAARLIAETGFEAIAVVDDAGRPVGLVTAVEIARWAARLGAS